MPRFSISEGGEVVNIIEAESLEIAQVVASGAEVIEEDGEGFVPGIGWRKSNGTWRRPEPPEAGPWSWDKTDKEWVKGQTP